MKKIYCLTLNDSPLMTSFEKEKLVNEIANEIERISNDSSLEIINRKDNSITFHTGISYVSYDFNVEELDII